MNAQMTAAVAYPDEQHMRIESIPVPELADNEVLIKVMSATLNTGTLLNWRILKRQALLPNVIGIHGAGIVEQVGATVHTFSPGERVHVDPVLSCGRCEECINDQALRCKKHVLIGSGAAEGSRGPRQGVTPQFERYQLGSYAEYWRVPEIAVEHLPAAVNFDVGCKLGTLAVSHSALRVAGTEPGATIVLTGASGASGSGVIKCAPLFGIERVIAVARSQESLDAVAKLEPGLVDPIALSSLGDDWETTGALTDAIRERMGGRGVDALIDFSPANPALVRQAIYSLESGRTGVLVGGNPGKLDLDYIRAMPMNQYLLKGHRGNNRYDILRLTDALASGRLVVDDLVTHKFPLERINDAIDHIDNRAGTRTWWVVVNPHDS